MAEETVSEHDLLFKKASALVMKQIPLHGKSNMPLPGWWEARKLRRAIVLFERVLQINPQNWPAMWLIGKVQQRFRNQSEALLWFERAYQINPSQPDVAREASLCAMKIGHNDVAIVFAHRAVQIEPTNPGLHANLALAYLLSGNLSDAQIAIERALVDAPSDTISKTICEMIRHFITCNSLPPKTTPALQHYWQITQNNKSKKI